jgi:LPS-assembly lipoprotein
MRPRAGRFAATLLASALAVTVVGCSEGGFRPMYGNLSANGDETLSRLADVDIAIVPGRVGQRLRNELIYQANGGDLPASPSYRLEIAIKEAVNSTLVQQDGDSLGQVYQLDANFRLISIADKRVVLQGTSFGRVGFERYDSIFANVRAKEDAENRAAKTVANDMKVRLAAYLSRG